MSDQLYLFDLVPLLMQHSFTNLLISYVSFHKLRLLFAFSYNRTVYCRTSWRGLIDDSSLAICTNLIAVEVKISKTKFMV
jgi:hypothetical protein